MGAVSFCSNIVHLGSGFITDEVSENHSMCLSLCNPMDYTQSMKPEYWSGYLFPTPRDLPNPAVKPRSPTFRQILYQLSHQGYWSE